jgi:DNA-binding transcriptional MerR regulator
MRIGELGCRAGVSARTLRHYEELGLLEARRRSNGYRDYDERDLRVVAEIRSLVELGFALEETRPFVECLRAGNPTGASCPDSRAVQRRKLAEVDDWLARLQAVRRELVAQLGDPPVPRCAVTPDEAWGNR